MNSNTCAKIVLALYELFDNTNVDRSHGIDHALKVLGHTDNALGISKEPEDDISRYSIRCAALLHDADNKKFFPESDDYQNARRILRQIFPGEKRVEELTIKMVSLVDRSGCIRGPEETWMLIPRMCVKLESIGDIGILKVWTYNKCIGRPLFLPNTIRATTDEEVAKIATPERFAKYLREKESRSMVDHFYDNLLHISTIEVLSLIDNPYLRSEVQRRHKIIMEFVLRFGRDGNIDIRDLNRLRAKEWK